MLLLRARGGRRLGRPVWLAWLPPARFLFFLKTFSFPFLIFVENRKRRVLEGFFMELIFNKTTISECSKNQLFGFGSFKIQYYFEFKLNLVNWFE